VLGVLYPEPTHGFAIAAQLAPHAEIGRIWSVSRPLTYRSLDQLVDRGLVRHVGDEPGAGPNRTILEATRTGRARLRTWLRTPVDHLRDLRSELLLKVVLAERCGVDSTDMLGAQRHRIEAQARVLATEREQSGDVVAMWRYGASQAGLRFLDELARRAAQTDLPSGVSQAD
jgi:PadR family transcriptional regulator AphA